MISKSLFGDIRKEIVFVCFSSPGMLRVPDKYVQGSQTDGLDHEYYSVDQLYQKFIHCLKVRTCSATLTGLSFPHRLRSKRELLWCPIPNTKNGNLRIDLSSVFFMPRSLRIVWLKWATAHEA
ncbi:hypothetical protein Dimus_018744 [Dionaea muscipula]